MPVIKIKRGTTAPTTSILVEGELALNTSNHKLYTNINNTVVPLNALPSDITTINTKLTNYFTTMIGESLTCTQSKTSVTLSPGSSTTVTFTLNSYIRQVSASAGGAYYFSATAPYTFLSSRSFISTIKLASGASAQSGELSYIITDIFGRTITKSVHVATA